MTSENECVLHVDFISVAVSAMEGRSAILAAASGLKEMECVLTIGAIEADEGSDFDLAVYFLLPSFADLEPFGTDPRYVRFLQGTVAPNLTAFSGASVRLNSPLPGEGSYGACLAIEAPEETYDWEVSEELGGWAEASSGQSVFGLAIGERQRYRGLGVAFSDKQQSAERPMIDGFEVTFLAGRVRRLA